MSDWLETLEKLAQSPEALAGLDDETRKRVRIASAKLAYPSREDKRAFHKTFRKKEHNDKRQRDFDRLHQSSLRVQRSANKTAGLLPLHAQAQSASDTPPQALPTMEGELETPRFCYICKEPYTRLHHFYDTMCASCGDLNFKKRTELADLRGTVGLVTGGRVKIGREIVLKLLRCGAHVIVTTRFPGDALQRFAVDPDFATFRDRLQVHGLDLRHTPGVEAFADELCRTLPRLDFIINNACQTVRRPPAYYAHLLEEERRHMQALGTKGALITETFERMGSAEMSQLAASVAYDKDVALSTEALFPRGAYDADAQQIDLRKTNSWRLRLHEVPVPELLEVQLVNAIAPFVLNARLKPLMLREPTGKQHIVNVSAMEGQFNRGTKTTKHPHTNMAKAALNMMTRTSAQDYVKDGIYMNSVDTGWVTDEDPAEIAVRKEQETGFQPPLDIVDGAARVLDPIISGYNTGTHVYGKFLKDYIAVAW